MTVRRFHALFAFAALAAGTAGAQARPTPVFGATAVREAVIAAPVMLRDATPAPAPVPAPAPRASGFATTGFAQFMSSPAGRVFRAVAGVGMIAGGIAMDSNGGNVLAIAGAVPLSAGLFDVCYLSPIFGGPFKGKDIRAAKK